MNVGRLATPKPDEKDWAEGEAKLIKLSCVKTSAGEGWCS